MMAQAARDPLFWAAMTVAMQDSLWAFGRPNATDLCIRCHSPGGWLEGRSEPTNGSALTASDFDGVFCDACHKKYDPFFESTFEGTREGNDWLGHWDETGLSATPSLPAATATRNADRSEAATVDLFNGTPFYDAGWQPRFASTWTENGGGQYFVAAALGKRASFADAEPKHEFYYSRYHKSRYSCATCHDVSNPAIENAAFNGLAPGDGSTVLPSEQESPSSYVHVERTFSEFLLSDYGVGSGADGIGPFAPGVFPTSQPGNKIATCQDCHMPDRTGKGCDKVGPVTRPSGSVEHPKSGQPLHDLTGGNAWVPWLLASTVPGSPNYTPANPALLGQGPALLTMDLTAGEALDPNALLAGVQRVMNNLQRAAALQNATYSPLSGALAFRVQNQTGHKLISGYPEGRRMYLNIRGYSGGLLVWEINPYDSAVGTLRGLGTVPLGTNEEHIDDLVYEAKLSSSLTGESHTFHFVLADGRFKDNRIPPKGFRIAQAPVHVSGRPWSVWR